MAKINRSDVIQKAVNELSISVANDKIPTETLDKVQLTYNLNQNHSTFVISGGTGGTGTNLTTIPNPSDRAEIWLTSITASYIKDAACDVATGPLSVLITPFESQVSTAIINFAVITLTAQQDSICLMLPYPIRLKPNTPLGFTGTFGAGVLQRRISATGFIKSSN